MFMYKPSCLKFLDAEVNPSTKQVCDIGAIDEAGAVLHSHSAHELRAFLSEAQYVCGHNIIHHDAQYLRSALPPRAELIDTLYLSPLLFPERPYHKLLKDDKLQTDDLNNPVNDCCKAKGLFYDELDAFRHLPDWEQQILGKLLSNVDEFKAFFHYVGFVPDGVDVGRQVLVQYEGRLCSHADIGLMAKLYPVELAFALALIRTSDNRSITPPWVIHQFPRVENVIQLLRHTRCEQGCPYCNQQLDVHRALKRYFGYDQFRTFGGEPLQESSVEAAVRGDSILTIFPTGGGKSLTFQLPALMEGNTQHGLTVVISPLQSLMKDQVDNLVERGILSAVTINGLLDPISRADAVNRVADGSATILYISPEMLRSKTIEHLLGLRHVVRFVIDEAHCFSAWGQDFRVDYLFIGQFIAKMQARRKAQKPIPVSCFTATAKQKVISDICDYFRRMLGVELKIFASSSERSNLHYSVIRTESDEEKYVRLRHLIGEAEGPSIVYVSRTKRTVELAQKLTRDGYPAKPFNGKMGADEKVANQNSFMAGKVKTIVATSAFGMGVDKKDVCLVVHYDISDSLENYVQEAGRAGRDPQMQARCYVLYGDQDLDKHFVLLNQNKLSLGEIQQVWKAVKKLTGVHNRVCCSALEIARQAGWDDCNTEMEMRVKTALAALEQAGYLERGNNVPHVYATGIKVKNMDEAHDRIVHSPLFDEKDRHNAVRIIKSLISKKSIANAQDDEAESRVDYLADILGLTKSQVISTIESLRQAGILDDTRDMTALLAIDDSSRRSLISLERFAALERFLARSIPPEGLELTFKQLNDMAVQQSESNSSVSRLRTLVYFLSMKGYYRKSQAEGAMPLRIQPMLQVEAMEERMENRLRLSRFILEKLYEWAAEQRLTTASGMSVTFSVVEMLRLYQQKQPEDLFVRTTTATIADVEEALLYLSKIGALKLEGGFLVLYNGLEIRQIKDNRHQYKQEDYKLLNEFYKQKIQQVHIVGEYANLMVKDYQTALQYVNDYFQMDHKEFVKTYFKGERAAELELNITPAKYHTLFGGMSARQLEIINDTQSRYIVVAAGPGSGKTRVLVHKMASLLLLEEVKHEQLLMLTFSRAAATEFKQRLIGLIGNAAHFVEIKTFHAYCFDLLGRIGNLDDAKDVVERAAKMIGQGEVEPNRICKTVLLIDEAQDMDRHEFALVEALMKANEEMRVIAVGDDDQNVYQFRGADSRYMQQLITVHGGRLYELTDNYRSCSQVVDFANAFASRIHGRMKSTPISAVTSVDGVVHVVQHTSVNMEIPLVNHLKKVQNRGVTAVLTHTNEEALRLAALLRYHHLPARLVQSMDGFRFSDLAEVQYMLRQVESRMQSPVVSADNWAQSKAKLECTYAHSQCLPQVMKALESFERTCSTIYLSDFKEFVFESSIEDFVAQEEGEVLVSTVHKAKGREFDTVFLYISNRQQVDDEYMRQLYVGLTRAKRNLFIHCASTIFNPMWGACYEVDTQLYPLPLEIMLSFSHRDVFLDFFQPLKHQILSLRSGTALKPGREGLYSSDNVMMVSYSAKAKRELEQWLGKGYRLKSAHVRYIVAWHKKEEGSSAVAVILPDIVLEKV